VYELALGKIRGTFHTSVWRKIAFAALKLGPNVPSSVVAAELA